MNTLVQALNWVPAERRRLLGQGAWAAIGQALAALGTLVGVRVITEVVTPDVFGTVTLLIGVSIFASNLLCMPVYQAAQRFYADAIRAGSVAQLRRVSVRMLRWAVAVLIVGFLMAGFAAQRAGAGSWLAFVVLALLVPFEAARAIEITFFGAARRQQPYGMWSAFEAWSKPLVAAGLVVIAGATPVIILFGHLLATVAGVFLFRATVKCEGTEGAAMESRESDSQLTGDMFKFSWPLVPLAITAWACSLADRFVVGGVLGLEWVGIYVAAYGLTSRPFIMSGTIVSQTLKPVYFNAVARGDAKRAADVLRWWLGITIAVGSIGVVAVAVGCDFISKCLLAEKFRSGAHLMPWIAAGYATQVVAGVFESVLYARRQTGRLLSMHVVAAIGAVVAAWVGASLDGARGVAIACPVSFGIQTLIFALAVIRSKT